jgi:hypothetical protein
MPAYNAIVSAVAFWINGNQLGGDNDDVQRRDVQHESRYASSRDRDDVSSKPAGPRSRCYVLLLID